MEQKENALYIYRDGKQKEIRLPQSGYGKIEIVVQDGKVKIAKMETNIKI